MSKVKILMLAVIVLVAVNLIQIGLFFFRQPSNALLRMHPKPHKAEGPKKIIIEKLHFNQQQIAAYEKLIQKHRETVRDYDEKIHEAKTQLYLTLNDNTPEKTLQLQKELAGLHQKIETIHYNHFADIKKICTSKQHLYFKELTIELASLFNRPKPQTPNQFN